MIYISWNINGIRATLKTHYLHDLIHAYKPDFLCLQEVKANIDQVKPQNIEIFANYPYIYWNSPTEKKGYSGTAIFTKHEPLSVYYGIDINSDIHNNEGRVVTLEYADYYLINVYTPNSKPDLSRLEYREKWDKDFLQYIQSLSKKRQVIVCGDLNVAHNNIDLKNFKTNKGKCGFTEIERHGFDNIIDSNHKFVDICRYLYPDVEGLYTWWSPIQKMARTNNSGWRIDYFIISTSFIDNKKVKRSDILSSVYGSDHCPVLLELESS